MSFDNRARTWDKEIGKVKRASAFAEEIIQIIQPGKNWKALEFGCGTGLLSEQLHDKFKSIFLIDNSQEMIAVLQEKILKKKLLNFYPQCIDLMHNNLEEKNFDIIYTLMTLHHIVDLNKILTIFNSLLKPGAYLCIADLVKEDGSFHSHIKDFHGYNGFDREELSDLLIKNGFEIIYYNQSFTIEKQEAEHLKKYPLFLLIGKKKN